MGVGFNATFLIQIFHFFIAYYLFYWLLFRPGIAILNKETDDLVGVHKLIEQNKEQLEECRSAQRHQWIAARNYFKQHAPHLNGAWRHLSFPPLSYTSHSDAHVKQLAQNLATRIVTQLESQ